MGGLGPGIGGLEYIVIGLVALLVLGPERLPVMMRKIGQWVGKARRMADEFRTSFEDMARQSELDDLRKEVEALRRGQGMLPLGPEAEQTFRDINSNLTGAGTPSTPPSLGQAVPVEPPQPDPADGSVRSTPKPRAKRVAPKAAKSAAKPAGRSKSATTANTKASKPKATRKKAADL